MRAEFVVTARPLRHAYFVVEDDIERFIDVASYCCTQWGGINNLIIPVKKAEGQSPPFQIEPLFERFIKSRRPDIFIDAVSDRDTTVGNSVLEGLRTYVSSKYPNKPLTWWEGFTRTYQDESVHPLNIAPTRTGFLSQGLVVPHFETNQQPSPLEEAIAIAAFGKIWDGQEEEFAAVYPPVQRSIAAVEDFIRLQFVQGKGDPTPLSLTLKGIENILPESTVIAPYVDVIIAQKPYDLFWFWNWRALSLGHIPTGEHRVIILSKERFFEPESLDALARLIRGNPPDAHYQTDLDVVFHYQNNEDIHPFLGSKTNFEEHDRNLSVSITSTPKAKALDNTQTQQPIRYWEGPFEDFCIYHEFGGDRSYVFQELSPGKNVFLVPNPTPHITSGAGHAVVLNLQSDFWEQYPQHLSVATLLVPNGTLESAQHKMQLSYTHTVSLREPARITVNVPSTLEMYKAYFGSRGYDVAPSSMSFYADGLLRIAGGLEKAGVLRSQIAYHILDFLAEKRTQKVAQEIRRLSLSPTVEGPLLQTLSDQGFVPQFQRNPKTFNAIFSRIRSILPNTAKRDCLRTLEELVKIKAVQPGLDIKCPFCGTTIWYGIGALDEQIKCLGCLEVFDLPLVDNPNTDVDRPFQYSLNPLANQAMDQDILPVITALLTLKTHHQLMYHPVPGMVAREFGKTQYSKDFDFIYVYKHELYGGECKAGGGFDASAIEAARLARKLGLRAFFFATTKPIIEEGKQLIADFQQEIDQDKDADHPFNIFILDEKVMFGGEQLPPGIPQ